MRRLIKWLRQKWRRDMELLRRREVEKEHWGRVEIDLTTSSIRVERQK